jgi:hypothetical protein
MANLLEDFEDLEDSDTLEETLLAYGIQQMSIWCHG